MRLRSLRRLLFLWLLLFLFPGLGMAQAQPTLTSIPLSEPDVRYRALLIGNNDYKHWPDLKTAINDVERLAEVLQTSYGFAPADVRLLKNATRRQILSAFQELQQVAQPKDRVLIYYAGHGHLEESNNDGYFGAIDDPGILAAHRLLSQDVGIFVEPSSAMSVAGLLERSDAGVLNKGATAVLTVTGHGLKDPQWALKDGEGAEIQPTKLPVDGDAVAEELELTGDRS